MRRTGVRRTTAHHTAVERQCAGIRARANDPVHRGDARRCTADASFAGTREPWFSSARRSRPPSIKNLMIAIGVVFVLQKLFMGLVHGGPAGRLSRSRSGSKATSGSPSRTCGLHSAASVLHAALQHASCPLDVRLAARARYWGPERRFLRYYLLCGIGAGVIIAALALRALPASDWRARIRVEDFTRPSARPAQSIGVSCSPIPSRGPERQTVMLFPFPIAFKRHLADPDHVRRCRWLISGPGSNISHLGHLGGVIVGWMLHAAHRASRGPLLSLEPDQVQAGGAGPHAPASCAPCASEEFERDRRRNNDRTIH